MAQNGGFDFVQFGDEDEAGNVPDIGRSYPDLQLQPQLGQEVYSERPKEGSTVVEPVTNHGSSTAETSYKNNLESTEPASGVNSSHTNGVSNPAQTPSVFSYQYSSSEGNFQQLTMVTRADGSRYIVSKRIEQHRSGPSLRKQRIKYLKIASIIACFAFFPLGIFAVYFAFRIEKEFNDGLMKGNIDRALKFGKLAINLAYVSFLLCIGIIITVVLLVVLTKNKSSEPSEPTAG